jgi:hypothetical protein
MNRPDTPLWDKNFKRDMCEWVRFHVAETEIDNQEDFMRWFMKFSKGRISPQIVKEVWNESK